MFETAALYQNDPQWKDIKLGDQNQETIGSWGCLLTSLTMVANGYGAKETPITINEKMKSAGGFQGALIIPAVLPSVCPGLVYKGYQPCEDSPAPMAQINTTIAAGKPVIVQVDRSPTAGLQTHWIVLYDKIGNDYYMKDPYRYSGDAPDKKIKVMDRYIHSGRDISKAITGVIWFEGTAPKPPDPEVPLPDDSITVYAAVDGLAFRGEPHLAGVLIKRLPLNAMLQTLESNAEAKVGVNGQWLQLEDSSGQQGYAAAWYLTKSIGEDDNPPPPPVVNLDDIEYYLVPTAEGLAVRTGPSYTAQLIKRVPLNTELGYLDSRAEVNKKVGVVNQWLQVYDASGTQGYVAAWYVTRKAGKPPTPPTTPPTEPPSPPTTDTGLVVVPTIEGLAFRSQPVVASDTLIKRLRLNTFLEVDEAEALALNKIGVQGQWLKIKDPTGQIGYAAAWYLKFAPQSDIGTELKLRTTAEGVALRHSKMIADYTLIKRLPEASIVLALEADAATRVGVYGEWLKVRDARGFEGYLAAWYVEKI